MLISSLFSKQNRSDEEAAEWERRQATFNKGYFEAPLLTGLVTFSGFVAAFAGSFTAMFMIANLRHGTVWVAYAIILGALVAAHLCLRAVRYQRRRHARHAALLAELPAPRQDSR